MARLAVLVLLLTAVASVSAANVIGGATSITQYIDKALNRQQKKEPVGGYDSVGSTAGIQGFLTGQYAVGASDNPLNSSAYALAVSTYGTIDTIPLLFSSYSLFTRKARGLRLTANIVAKIYLGEITHWNKVDKKLKGVIVPVCRADGSGSTGVVTYWLSTTTNGFFPYIGNNPLNSGVLPRINKHLITGTGTDGVVAAIKAHKNALGYAQTGYGISFGLYAAKVRNPAGKFIAAANANLEQSIPASLPATTADWSNVHLVNQPGAQTYPITSFEYSFWRSNYKGSSFQHDVKNLRKFFEYVLSGPGQKLAKRNYFDPLPSTVAKRFSTAVKKIK